MKKLIVNGDDLGLTDEVNEGIIRAHEEGILTSASLVASGEAFERAIELIRLHPSLDVGVHLTLIEEKPVLPALEIPSLVREDGYFRRSARQFYFDYLRNEISLDEVESELRAQIEKISSQNIVISHMDSHQHIHVLPKILGVVLRLAEELEIRVIRAPFEKIRLRWLLSVSRWHRLMQMLAIRVLLRRGMSMLESSSPDHFFGFMDGGRMDESRLCEIISELPDGVSEIMCHPGLNGSRSQEKYGHWGYNWRKECETLVHKPILELIARKNVILTSFRSFYNSGGMKKVARQ
jgi:hopanoid biosynthesis associated protein HpnK